MRYINLITYLLFLRLAVTLDNKTSQITETRYVHCITHGWILFSILS